MLDDDIQKSDVHHKIARLYLTMGMYGQFDDEYLKVIEFNHSNEEAKEEMERVFEEEVSENRSFFDRVLRMLFN